MPVVTLSERHNPGVATQRPTPLPEIAAPVSPIKMRDYFAGLAMQVLMSQTRNAADLDERDMEKFAEVSYDMAFQMLKVRATRREKYMETRGNR